MRHVMLALVCVTLSMAPSAASGLSQDAREPQGRIAYSNRFWPKNSRIVDNWELFVTTLGRGKHGRLTRNPRCDEVHPAWSHDGERIAFACGWGPSAGIYVMRDDGSGRRGVVKLPNRRVNGTAWSPDDRRIAFDAGGIWVVNADGGARRRLTSGRDSSPTWSRDGRSIAYEHNGDAFLMRADGTRRRRIARGASSPAWSPNGRWIAFVRGVDIWITNPDGRRQRRLPCCRRTGVAAVSWSPDSRYLAFDGGSGLAAGVHVMSVDGTSRRYVGGGPELLGFSWGSNAS